MKLFAGLAKNAHPLQRLVPTKVIRSRLLKRTFQQFADRAGLVYFGYVDQRNDDHSLIRGLTVSTKHRDNHYCIGSYENYDVALVERVDTIHFPGKPPKTHVWTIMTFDLHHAADLPHMFIGLHSHGDAFYAQLFTKYAHLAKVPMTISAEHDKNFLKHYTLYAKIDHALHVEGIFNPAVTKVIAEQFGSLAIEISENTVYLYAEQHRPTGALLDKMLMRGLWLARTLDQLATVDN